jgi:ribosome-associated toxin RatA of RatAB toxin-antitoxin module
MRIVIISDSTTSASMTSAMISTPLSQLTAELSPADREALCAGKPLVTGENGNYVGWVLVAASPEVAWSVLTDYENFEQFLPTVASSSVIEADASRKVVEQVDSRRILMMDVESTVRTENVEQAPDRIYFQLVDGDLKTLQGYWNLYPIATEMDDRVDRSPQVLVTQTVEAEANAGLLEGMFHQVFAGSLSDNLRAIQQEAERRSLCVDDTP